MLETLFLLTITLFVTSPLWIIIYREWKFNKYVNKDYSIYSFKCPGCFAESDRLKIINFDNCCHGFSIDEVDGELVSRGYAGSKVVCEKCGQVMHILYFLNDLEENHIFYLYELLKKKPKEPLVSQKTD